MKLQTILHQETLCSVSLWILHKSIISPEKNLVDHLFWHDFSQLASIDPNYLPK